jgi:fructose-1,6-bisphosphatase/inositol monophosphatase family enzyme
LYQSATLGRRTHGQLERELAVATRLVRETGEAARDVARRPVGQHNVQWKGREPHTDADREGHRILADGLTAAFPKDGIISEEAPVDSRVWRRSRIWVIDPIDGTVLLMAGMSGWSVMVGLLVERRPVLGLVYDPLTDQLFHGVVGQGSFLNDRGRVRRIHVSTRTQREPDALILGDSGHRRPHQHAVARSLGIKKGVLLRSNGHRAAGLACGTCDVFVTPARKFIWDLAPTEPIVEAAGGRYTDLYGKAFSYGPNNVRAPHGIVGTNGAIHEWAIERLTDYRDVRHADRTDPETRTKS